MNAEPDEREWWAAREIKHLRAINAELLAFLQHNVVDEQDDCVSPGIKALARIAIAKAKL